MALCCSAFFIEYRAHFSWDWDLARSIVDRALLMEYRAFSTESTAVLSECRALFTKCRALLFLSQTLVAVIDRALFSEC